jgi:hypothetical protein
MIFVSRPFRFPIPQGIERFGVRRWPQSFLRVREAKGNV